MTAVRAFLAAARGVEETKTGAPIGPKSMATRFKIGKHYSMHPHNYNTFIRHIEDIINVWRISLFYSFNFSTE